MVIDNTHPLCGPNWSVDFENSKLLKTRVTKTGVILWIFNFQQFPIFKFQSSISTFQFSIFKFEFPGLNLTSFGKHAWPERGWFLYFSFFNNFRFSNILKSFETWSLRLKNRKNVENWEQEKSPLWGKTWTSKIQDLNLEIGNCWNYHPVLWPWPRG